MISINALANAGLPSAAKAPTSTDSITSGDFLRVLSAQLSTQDPLAPMDQSQFLSQLAQFTQLAATRDTNDQLTALAQLQESLAAIQQMTQGAALIGQNVEYLDITDGSTKSGTVNALRTQQGLVVADIDGQNVPLTLISAVLGSSIST